MRRVLPVLLILSVSLLPTISYGGVETSLPIEARFLKVRIIEDGKPSRSSMVVSLTVTTAVDEKLTKRVKKQHTNFQ